MHVLLVLAVFAFAALTPLLAAPGVSASDPFNQMSKPQNFETEWRALMEDDDDSNARADDKGSA